MNELFGFGASVTGVMECTLKSLSESLSHDCKLVVGGDCGHSFLELCLDGVPCRCDDFSSQVGYLENLFQSNFVNSKILLCHGNSNGSQEINFFFSQLFFGKTKMMGKTLLDSVPVGFILRFVIEILSKILHQLESSIFGLDEPGESSKIEHGCGT